MASPSQNDRDAPSNQNSCDSIANLDLTTAPSTTAYENKEKSTNSNYVVDDVKTDMKVPTPAETIEEDIAVESVFKVKLNGGSSAVEEQLNDGKEVNLQPVLVQQHNKENEVADGEGNTCKNKRNPRFSEISLSSRLVVKSIVDLLIDNAIQELIPNSTRRSAPIPKLLIRKLDGDTSDANSVGNYTIVRSEAIETKPEQETSDLDLSPPAVKDLEQGEDMKPPVQIKLNVSSLANESGMSLDLGAGPVKPKFRDEDNQIEKSKHVQNLNALSSAEEELSEDEKDESISRIDRVNFSVSRDGSSSVDSEEELQRSIMDIFGLGDGGGDGSGNVGGNFTSAGQLGESSNVRSLLTNEESKDRIRDVFKAGLAVHLDGEEMEACRAVKTELYSHQRVALAWMVKHETVTSGGMLGGILADDMGLGKTLTVIACILTNHWDGRPLLKPELGYVRPSISKNQVKTKGKKEKFRPRTSAAELGVGSKVGAKTGKKRVFREADFDYCNSSDSEAEDELDLEEDSSMEDFINDASMSSNQESDQEEEEEVRPTKRKRGSSKKRIKNCIDSSSEDEMPKNESDKVEVEEDISLGVNSEIVLNPKLNLDGFFDETSSDEELLKPKRKKQKQTQKSKIIQKSKMSVSSDSEIDLPSPTRGEKSKKVEFGDEDCEPGTSGVLDGQVISGLKRVVPPREPAERRGRQRTTLIVCPTSLISHW